MKLLAFDTATPATVVALRAEGRLCGDVRLEHAGGDARDISVEWLR